MKTINSSKIIIRPRKSEYQLEDSIASEIKKITLMQGFGKSQLPTLIYKKLSLLIRNFIGKRRFWVGAGLFALLLLLLFIFTSLTLSSVLPAPDLPLNGKFKDYHMEQYKSQANELLPLLRAKAVSEENLAILDQKLKLVLNTQADRRYNCRLLFPKKNKETPYYLMLDLNRTETLVVQLQPEVDARLMKKKVESHPLSTCGVIDSNLWLTLLNSGVRFPHQLLQQIESALEFSVDLHHLERGDLFKILYEEQFVEGQNLPVGIGKVKAIYFRTNHQDYYAYHYDDGVHKAYYNHFGHPMDGRFLRAPVKYARISSHYSLSRKHPVTGIVKPHRGTDYAAPRGTAILSVADGVVEKTGWGKYNGRFVVVRHDNRYKTGYLHMCRVAKDLKEGKMIKRGQVIGYVGSTGLASGPHVCFRFWKNGKQINHLFENFPEREALQGEEATAFFSLRDSLKMQLDGLEAF